jgi:hypothetical protein
MSSLLIIACAFASAAVAIALMVLLSRQPDPRHEFIFRLIGDLSGQEAEESHEAHYA